MSISAAVTFSQETSIIILTDDW